MARRHTTALPLDELTVIPLPRGWRLEAGWRHVNFAVVADQLEVTYPLRRAYFGPRPYSLVCAIWRRGDVGQAYWQAGLTPVHEFELAGTHWVVLGGEVYDSVTA